MNSLASIVSCAIKHKLTLADINGNLNHWLTSCRNPDGSQSSAEEFRVEFERQMSIASQSPSNSFEVEGK